MNEGTPNNSKTQLIAQPALSRRSASPRRKPRPASSIFTLLTPAQQETLFTWLCTGNISYQAALARMQTEWGVTVKINKVSTFWKSYCSPRLLRSGQADGPVRLQIILRSDRLLAVELQTEGQP